MGELLHQGIGFKYRSRKPKELLITYVWIVALYGCKTWTIGKGKGRLGTLKYGAIGTY